MADIPFDLCVERAEQVIAQGGMIYQKFTCVHCGSRQTMATANRMYKQGDCEECSKRSNIKACGFMAAFGGQNE
jgi:hypothetical protein